MNNNKEGIERREEVKNRSRSNGGIKSKEYKE